MAELIVPDPAYRDSFLEALTEFQAEGRHVELSAAQLAADFPAFVRALRERADDSLIPPDRVPDTVLWLVEDDRFLGRISIRHTLNDRLRRFGGHIGYEIRSSARGQGFGSQMLSLALERTRCLGLERVLVTCDVGNVASRKIIERNGGELEGTFVIPDWPEPVMRFWITAPSSEQTR